MPARSPPPRRRSESDPWTIPRLGTGRNRKVPGRIRDERDVALCRTPPRCDAANTRPVAVHAGECVGGGGQVTRDELVVAFALTRLDHPTLDLEEVAALLVRRMGTEQTLQLATQNLATRDELRGTVFAAAVEHVLRTLLLLRDGPDD